MKTRIVIFVTFVFINGCIDFPKEKASPDTSSDSSQDENNTSTSPTDATNDIQGGSVEENANIVYRLFSPNDEAGNCSSSDAWKMHEGKCLFNGEFKYWTLFPIESNKDDSTCSRYISEGIGKGSWEKISVNGKNFCSFTAPFYKLGSYTLDSFCENEDNVISCSFKFKNVNVDDFAVYGNETLVGLALNGTQAMCSNLFENKGIEINGWCAILAESSNFVSDPRLVGDLCDVLGFRYVELDGAPNCLGP